MVKNKLSRTERLKKLRQKIENTDMGGGQGFFSPKQGSNTIRILPEVKGMEFFFQTVGRHYFNKKSVYCPSFTSDGELECPICEIVSELYSDGSKSSKALASDIRVRKSYWMNIIDRENESVGPLIFTPGVTIMGGITALIGDPDWGDILDIDDGFDITIQRKGTGMDTEYQVNPKRNPSELSKDEELAEKWLLDAKDLSFVELSEDSDEDKEISSGHAVYLLTYDRIVVDYNLDDLFSVEEDEEEEEETQEEIEDEEVEEEVDEDDDEEEETPREQVKRRRARRSRRK